MTPGVARRLVVALERLGWAILILLASAMLLLRYWALPNIERWQPDIVAAISRGIGLEVRVASIQADWPGLRPQVQLSGVRILDREGRDALVLPTVTAVLSWRSLAFLDLRMRSFAIDAPRLSVRRDGAGAIYIAGAKLALSDEAGEGRLADWLLGQNEILVRDAEIDWTDELRGAPTLALRSLEFRLHNEGDLHEIGISAKPPPQLGSGLELRASLVGRSATQPSAWNGRVFAELGYTDLAGWRQWVDYPLDVRAGQGALRVWATLGDGRLTRATADVALTGVRARLGRDLPVLDITSVRGRIQGHETPNGYEFGARNLALVTPDGPEMRSTSFVARIEGATPRRTGAGFDDAWRPNRGAVNASQIELAPLVHLADRLPIPDDLRKVLAELSPQGRVQDVRFEWQGALPDAATFKAKGRFQGLGVRAWRQVPGFQGLSGSVDATETKGTLQLASVRAELELPRVFPEPRIALDALSGQLDWERRGERGVALRVANLAFANTHAAGTLFGTYAWSGEGPGTIDLSSQVSRADGRHVAKYLPLVGIMGADAREWLSESITEGRSSDVRLRLKGDLADFPFDGGAKGQFQVMAKVTQARLRFAEGWPAIEGIDGDLLFENERMEVVARSGRLLGARIANVRATLPNLMADRRELRVQGGVDGPTQEFLRFVAQSPVRRYIDGMTDDMSARGAARLALKLDLPLWDLSRARVNGELRLAPGNSVTVDPRLPPIERAAGAIAFTDTTLELRDVKGAIFGAPVAIEGGTQKEGGIAVTARGAFRPESVRGVFDHPWLRFASGSAPFTATVSTRAGVSRIAFESSLAGIALGLPPPLEKAPAATLPLRVEIVPGESGARERISVGLGRVVQAEFLRAREGGEMRTQRSAIALSPVQGEAIRLPERRGMLVYGALPSLDLDRWRPLMAGGAGDGGPASFDLRFASLDAFGKRLRTVAMKGGADGGGWSANVSAAELSGDLSYRAEGNGRLSARLGYFSLPEDVPGLKPAAAASSTRDFPAVDLVAESFSFRGRRLGRVEIAAEHDGPAWRIHRIAMLNPDSTLNARGNWQVGASSRTSLTFSFESPDVGKFLERIGHPEHVKAGRGKLSGSLAWNGDPTALDYPSLSGELQLSAEDGQFLEIEPGIGKLVSLMSLQMLPRRIALDFRDVFSKGFQFDKIGAAFVVRQGIMTTRDFRMNGPAADVEMAGDIDLARETQNLQVKVIPQLGDTASTVVGLVNPIAGVATLIAGRLMKNPLGQVFAFQYQITGGWADPKVAKAGGPPPPAQTPGDGTPAKN